MGVTTLRAEAIAMSTLPEGTATFLFTDIEGSTRLWERAPEAMREALARHDALLREAVEAHRGHVFKTIGDAFCAVFAAAPDALVAALAAQRELAGMVVRAASEVSGTAAEEMGLRVRMAVHAGTAQARDGDYFGPTLNRIARLLAVGHGGQVLLSQAACDLLGDALPSQAGLRDLGSHRLKDLQQPEHIYQLLHPDLPADFPPLRSLSPETTNLPVQLTSFIGREKEMEEIKRLLSRTRLLTLTGSGGCGKTRLAAQVGADLLADFADGVWLVELAAIADPALVPQTVASTLGIREEPGQRLLETLQQHLKPKSLLLLLDNCEHLSAACAQLAETLLQACPNLRILASSREALGIAGELAYRVPSLSLPELPRLPSAEAALVPALARCEATRLFVERAALSYPGFALTEQNAPAVAQVCVRLDGIPLAIELAAARIKVLSADQIAARLDDRFRLLTGGSRTALPRQQTLRALIDWSYDLLSEAERTLLRRLSVFAGGWTLEAAEAVCSADALHLLTSLVDKSLAVYEEQAGEARYRLLETVREYARDRLLESGEMEEVRERHFAFFLRMAEEIEPKLTGLEQAAWLDRLEGEYDNLRAASGWALSAAEGAQAGLRLAGALWRFWEIRGHIDEGRGRLKNALDRPDAREP